MKKIRKAIIPAAGLGTRFLPATKGLPKEMLPIIDIPTIQYIIEEAIDSGIEEILIIDNMDKAIIHKYFSVDEKLENKLLETGKKEEYDLVHHIGTMCTIKYVQQNDPKGLGHAVSLAEEFAAGEPFAILLGDDLMTNIGGKPVLRQMIEAFDEVNSSILGVQEVAREVVHKYGVVKPISIDGRIIKISDYVEKPKTEEAPSCYAGLGRYILTPTIFNLLNTQKPGKGGEIQLTDAIRRLMDIEGVYAYDFEGVRYDVGDKFGFVKAVIDFSLRRDDLKDKVQEYINSIAK